MGQNGILKSWCCQSWYGHSLPFVAINVCGLTLRYEIVHKEYGASKIKEEVYNSISCGYVGKNLHTIIFSSFYESFKHSKIIHCCFFRKCEMVPLHSQSMLSELLCIISPWQFLCAVELEILHNNYLI